MQNKFNRSQHSDFWEYSVKCKVIHYNYECRSLQKHSPVVSNTIFNIENFMYSGKLKCTSHLYRMSSMHSMPILIRQPKLHLGLPPQAIHSGSVPYILKAEVRIAFTRLNLKSGWIESLDKF